MTGPRAWGASGPRTWGAAALAAIVVLSVARLGPAGAGSSGADPVEVQPLRASIQVEATRDIMVDQSSPWLDAMAESELASVTYRSVSSATARRHLVEGSVDAAIVGSPFTAEDLADIDDEFIAVPVHVSTAMVLVSEPFPDGFDRRTVVTPEENPICDPLGDDYDQSACETHSLLTGPIRLPPANLAAMLLNVNSDGLRTWRHPDVLAALEAPDLDLADADAPSTVNREAGESVNLHLQRYAAVAAPDVWEKAKAENPGVDYALDESIPRALTRSSPSFQVQQVGLWANDPKTGGTTSSGWAGNLAAVPPTARLELESVFPDTPYRVIQVQNGAGEWIEPTPDAINRAVDAGGGQPLYAVDHATPGAYPLVWVDHLLVRTSGLTPEKANAVASFVRYLATAGQAQAASLGEGRLSAALVAQALDGADLIVRSNCTGSDQRVVNDPEPGPYAPPELTSAATGEVDRCAVVEAGPPPTTTSTSPPQGGGSGSTIPSTTMAPAASPTTSQDGPSAPAVTGSGGGGSSGGGVTGLSTSGGSGSSDTSATTGPARGSSGSEAPDPASSSRATGSAASGADTSGEASTPAEVALGQASPAASVSGHSLPFPPLSSISRRIDEFSTMILGAGLFVAIRRLIQQRRSARPA